MEADLSEFDIIEIVRRQLTENRSDAVCGIGDDGAVLQLPAGHQLVVSIDTLVESVHFSAGTSPRDIGFKALAVNLSDLAAMGASPAWATLALTLPRPDAAWVQGFAQGFFELSSCHGIQLVGGDTTRGPLTITVQAHGLIPNGQFLTRAGARPGDRIFVTGVLGAAAFALHLQNYAAELPETVVSFCEARLHRPEPRVEFGTRLPGIATSAIDISDGFAQDLGHVLEASEVGAELEAEAMPLVTLPESLMPLPLLMKLALTGGDDYELCFTAPPQKRAIIESIAIVTGVPCTCVGTITSERAFKIRHRDGKRVKVETRGYRHF